MNKSIWAVAVASALFAGAFAVRAEDAPATQPAGKHATSRPSGVKMIGDYAKLTDLTDEQKSKINEIHKKALADEKVIKDKEEADSRAVLTDAQKAELDKLDAEKKEKMSEKKKEKKEPKKEGAAPAAPAAPAAGN